MKNLCSLTRKRFALAGFCKLCFLLIFSIVPGSNLVSAQNTQTPQAYVAWTYYCYYYYDPTWESYDYVCIPVSPQLVTPWGWTSGPNDTQPTWSADGRQIAFTRD